MVTFSKIKKIIFNKKQYSWTQLLAAAAYLLLIAAILANTLYITPFYGEIEKYAFFALVITTIALLWETIVGKNDRIRK